MYTYRGCLGLSCLWSKENTSVVGDGSGRANRFCRNISKNTVILGSPADHPSVLRFGREGLVMGRED